VEFLSGAASAAAVVAPGALDLSDAVPDGRAVTIRADALALRGLVVDEALTQAFVTGAAPGSAAAGKALAELAFLAVDRQVEGAPTGAVVVLPRGWDPGEASPQGLLELLGSCNWVSLESLDAAIGREAAPTVSPAVASAVQTGPSAPALTKLTQAAEQIQALAGVTDDPVGFARGHLTGLLAPLAVTADATEREALAATALELADHTLAQVKVVTGSEVNLISDDGRVPIVVSNDLAVPVSELTVALRPNTQALRADQTATVSIASGGSATARLPVHAVANGSFTVQVELLGPDGHLIGPPSTLTMRVRAEWETVGTWAMAGVFAVILGFGIFRTVGKRRADARRRLTVIPEER
jgi:hypothetical protein